MEQRFFKQWFVPLLVAASVWVVAPVYSLEQQPWYGNAFEIEWRPSLTYSSYNDVDTIAGTVSRSSDDLFATAEVGSVLFQRWHIATELLLVSTDTQNFAVGHVAAAVRYLVLDDIIGDPVSLVAGATVLAPFADPDISLRYHGNIGAEGHIALGKECACGPTWSWRWWGLAAVGIADEGDPWVKGRLSLEKNFCDCHEIELYSEALAGLGGRDLNLAVPFSGYERIAHRSVDVGVGYTWCVAFCADVTAEYQYRVYAENTAEGVHRMTVAVRYPFSL